MQRTPSSRKRAAPGASPMTQQPAAPQTAFDESQMPQNLDFSNFDFTQFPIDQSYQDASLSDANIYANAINGSQAPTYGSNLTAVTPSTDLVRRTRNNQLAPHSAQQEQWNGYNTSTMQGSGDEDEQELERKVALAKKDAQGKRKQIPPFVQKLSSFLDSGNTELIRWSDDGRSFIVIDEDEFARTLIPELFKHNNYASFVRQLNMYGFHKTVNITDGSLRQSEKARKGVKPPSMYSHPYFRRNRPDLLWLIQKPLGKAGTKRKRDETVKADDSDGESPGPDGRPQGELGLTSTGSDLATMPRNDMTSVRRELQNLQRQQKYISDMIAQLKKQNDSFYRQATQFQQLHDRHESSINAILTFLATFYSRSLDGHAGQNLVNMFSNMAQQNNQQHGSVVEDFTDAVPESNTQMQRFKRPQFLLEGPASPRGSQQPATTQTTSTSARSSISPVNENQRNRPASVRPSSSQPPQSISPQVKNDAPTPDVLNTVPESDQMMSLINSVNATNASSSGTAAPAWDFNSALNHYQNANGNAPLTPQQRDDMLAMMANQQGSSNGNNALVSPTPPAMPDLNQIKQSQQQLEMLTNMQRTQDDRVQELSRRLQPLSPTGTIPGIADGPDGGGFFDPTGAPGDFDPNNFIDFNNDNDLNFSFADTGNDVDWDFGNTGNVNGGVNGGAGGMNTGFDTGSDMFNMSANGQESNQLLQPDQQYDGGGRVESVSSAATSPAGTVEEVQDGSASKRRRKS